MPDKNSNIFQDRLRLRKVISLSLGDRSNLRDQLPHLSRNLKCNRWQAVGDLLPHRVLLRPPSFVLCHQQVGFARRQAPDTRLNDFSQRASKVGRGCVGRFLSIAEDSGYGGRDGIDVLPDFGWFAGGTDASNEELNGFDYGGDGIFKVGLNQG